MSPGRAGRRQSSADQHRAGQSSPEHARAAQNMRGKLMGALYWWAPRTTYFEGPRTYHELLRRKTAFYVGFRITFRFACIHEPPTRSF